MKSFSKSTAEKQGKICWLVARWSGGGKVGRVKQLVSVGLWEVSDGFCWLRVILDGFK